MTFDQVCEIIKLSLPYEWDLNIRFTSREGKREVDVWLYGPDGEEWPDRRHCETVSDEIRNAINNARDYHDLPTIDSLDPKGEYE